MKRSRMLFCIAALVGVVVVAAGVYRWSQLDGQAPTWSRVVKTETGGTPTYDPIQYRAKDAREAISDPQFVSSDEADIAAGTMGIGVAIKGEAKFYPLYILAYNQIVNDTCAGVAIACTY